MCTSRGSPRFHSRTPFRPVAARIRGSAAWRESTFASSRVKRRQRAAASVAPLRETPGTSAHACPTPSASPSIAVADSRNAPAARDPSPPSRVRRARARRRSSRACRGAARSAARTGTPALPRARTTARAASSRRRSSPRASRRPRAQADQQRRRGAGVQRDLECLAQLRVELAVAPSGQPRHERDVARGGDRQQLGRPVQHAQRERLAQRQGRVAHAATRTRLRRQRTT